MKKLNKEKRILYALILILLLVIIPLIVYTVFFKNFKMKDFKENIVISLNETFEFIKPNACYGNLFHCENVTVETVSNNIDTSKLGAYKIVYKLEYRGKSTTKEQIIEVKDLESPVISLDVEQVNVCPNGKISQVSYKANDNLDGDLTEKVTSRIDGNEVVYEVTDANNNKTEKRISAIVEDKESPNISLKGDAIITLPIGGNYEELGYEVVDNCSDNLTSQVKVEGNVNTQESGEYTLTYTVTDESGNTGTITRKVYAYNKSNYDAPSGKSIYLTFDDGPSAYTNQLLDILGKYNVKVTFFVTNQGLTKGHDNAIKRAFDEGHTIGLHTYSHNYKTIYASDEAYFNDLYAIQKKVKDITGYESKIIRFPGGSSNTISIGNKGLMSRLTKAVEAKGFRYWDWNVYGGDAGETTNPSKIAANIIKELGSGSTYVVLQHDIKEYSVKAVEAVIQFGLSHGYTFRPLTMDSPTSHHRVNN